MRRAVAGVHVAVDEPGADEHAARVDLCVDTPVEAPADVQDAVVLVHHHAVGNERVSAAREADHPPAAHEGPHA